MFVVLLVGRRTDEAQVACFQVGLEHVRGIHGTVADSPGTHQRVYLVNIDDVVLGFATDAVHNLLDAVLEVAAILCARQERPHVELVDAAVLQSLWHVAAVDAACQPPYQCRLADARFADVQRIVLVTAAEHLNGALKLCFAANERVAFLHVVVHAGDEPSPSLFAGFLVAFAIFHVVNLVGGDEATHEVLFIVAECFLEQIAGPRVLQLQQRHDEMWCVEHGCTTEVNLFTGFIE